MTGGGKVFLAGKIEKGRRRTGRRLWVRGGCLYQQEANQVGKLKGPDRSPEEKIAIFD